MKRLLLVLTIMLGLVQPSSAEWFDFFKSHKIKNDDIHIKFSPKANETNVSPNVVITARFNEDIDPISVKKNNIIVKKISGKKRKRVHGKLSYDKNTKTISFTPNESLKEGTYRVSFTNLVKIKKYGHVHKKFKLKHIRYSFEVVEPSVVLESLSLSTDTNTLRVSQTTNIILNATYSDGSESDVTNEAIYTSSDTNVADVVGNSIEAFSEGSSTITATLNGITSNTIQVEVKAPIDTSNFNFTHFGSQYTKYIPTDATLSHYDEELFAMVTGKILAEDGSPLSGVKVTIHNHPEYGSQITNVKGEYYFATEGGIHLIMRYTKEGYTTIDRELYVQSQDWNNADDATMLQVDSKVTTIDLNSTQAQLHISTPVIDDRGQRSTTLVFDGVSKATVSSKDGTTRELTSINVRATEFKTPESMPADLPIESAYTYCTDIKVDGVSDDENVSFDAPVVMYVENFLGFNVGEIVPVGYYDRNKGEWVCSDNGIVIQLLDTDGDGVIDALDSDGDGEPNDLDSDGVFSDEVKGIIDNIEYKAGQTYWRAEITHFTPWDHNWPYGPPDDAEEPKDPDIDDNNPDDPCSTSVNSYIKPKTRVFHEDISIAGTDIKLHYSSKRSSGYKYNIKVFVNTIEAPASAISATAVLKIAGRTFSQAVSIGSEEEIEFLWDGNDILGEKVVGKQLAKVSVIYEYPSIYYSANSDFERSWARVGSSTTNIRGRSTIDIAKNKLISLYIVGESNFNTLAKGWSLSNYMEVYNNIIVDGNANINTKYSFDGSVSIFAGNGNFGYSGDGNLATSTSIDRYTEGIVSDKHGNIFIANNSRVLKVDEAGVMTTIVGNGECGDSGDGGLAINAQVCYLEDIAIDSKGNLYITDAASNKIRKIDTSGVITTIAGNGSSDFSGDGGFAIEASLGYPTELAIDKEDNIYVIDYGNNRIRKIDSCGLISTVVGNGGYGISDDGTIATDALLGNPDSIAVDINNNLFISNIDFIQKVDNFGKISTIAGNGEGNLGIIGESPLGTSISHPTSLDIDSKGNLYISDFWSNQIYMIDNTGSMFHIAGTGENSVEENRVAIDSAIKKPHDIHIDSKGSMYISLFLEPIIFKYKMSKQFSSHHEDNIEYKNINNTKNIFDRSGKYLAKKDMSNDKDINTFTYNFENQLISSSDSFGNTIVIERDSEGNPTTITAPNGQKTYLIVDENGDLISVSYEDGSAYTFEYDGSSLMTNKIDPNGNEAIMSYDENGRIYQENDHLGADWKFYKGGDAKTQLYSIVKPEGDERMMIDTILDNGSYQSIVTLPTGDKFKNTVSVDGRNISTLYDNVETNTSSFYNEQNNRDELKTVMVSQPSGLKNTTTYTTVYDGNETHTFTKTKTITQNEKISKIVEDYNNATKTITTPENRTLSSSYNKENRLTTSVQSGTLLATTYEYDEKGRVTKETTGSRETTYTYDAKGNIATVTNAKGETTSYAYDIMDRVTTITHPNGATENYEYDFNSNMTKLTTPTPTNFNFTYNGIDKRTSLTSPLGYQTSYTYNKNRKLTSITRPSGKTIANTYVNDRLASTTTSEGTVNYTYLFAEKVGSITQGSESIVYGYDGDLLTSQTFSGVLDQSINYTYNNDFLVTGLTYAGATENYTYDNDGLLTSSGAFTITRDASNGYVTKVSDGTLNINKEYNDYAELISKSDNVFTYTLQRDAKGMISQKTESLNGVDARYDYEYDSRGRLTQVTKDNQVVENYTYDANGNRISATVNGVTTTAYYTLDDQTEVYGDNTYTYDEDGQLVTKQDSSGTTTYTYNTYGALTDVTLKDGTTIKYHLNPLNQRVAKEVNGVITEKYLWRDLTTLLAVYDKDDNLIQRYNYADERVPTSLTQDNQTYYLHYDQVGTLRVVTDADHNIIKEITYDTYGNILQDTNPDFKIPFGFAGGLSDRDTNLVHFGYREYDPYTAKWTTKDPIDFSGGDTNLYGYVLNDPVNLIDPEGTNPLIGAGLIAGGIVGGVLGALSTPSGGNVWGNAVAGALTGALGGVGLAVGNPYLGLALDALANSANVLNACQ